MSTSDKATPGSSRWYYLLLFALDLIRKSKPESGNEISILTFPEIRSASESVRVKAFIVRLIEKVRVGKRVADSDKQLISLVKTESALAHPKPYFLSRTDVLVSLIDKDFTVGMISNRTQVAEKLEQGFTALESISKAWHHRAKCVLEVVCGIGDEHNLINSGFTKDIPGFISLNANADAVVIGEQIVHETTHLLLDNILFFNQRAKSFIQAIPPTFSVFANKPRTGELMVHGLFSYTSVYLYWEKLPHIRASTANRRKQQVSRYIRHAVQTLDHVLTPSMWLKLERLYKKICPLPLNGLWFNYIKKKSNAKCRLPDSYFNDIEKAEILLAIEGNKVSRISKPLSQIQSLIPFLEKSSVHFCFSSFLFESAAEEKTRDFKNVITGIHNLDNHAGMNFDIHIYLSSSKSKLRRAHLLDQQDRCGDLFGTPRCCQKFFLDNWEKAVSTYDGDLVRLAHGREEFMISEGLIYSPAGMYFGYGLCWHFTCSPTCKKTRATIDRRMEVLKKYPALLGRLMKIRGKRIQFNSKKGYQLI